MDASTRLISSQRDTAVPLGGYEQYRRVCSQKLLHLRRKLNIVTPKGRAFTKDKSRSATAQSYGENAAWREYYLFSAERAWAHALEIKDRRASDTGEAQLNGQVRSHILSGLNKAAKFASELVHLSEQQTENEGGKVILLAHAAYWQLLVGVGSFESQKWERSLKAFSNAYTLYSALDLNANGSPYRDWIADNIEPSIRYAAYKLGLPRTTAIARVVASYVDTEDAFIKQALVLSPSALVDDKSADRDGNETSSAAGELPTSITWRGRTVKLEDARIAQALGSVKKAEAQLLVDLKSQKDTSAKDRAEAYDTIIGCSKDAVDATKDALDELALEGVASSDARMQSLQITRTAVSYEHIGWQIGRNRVLCGRHDGLHYMDTSSSRSVNSNKQESIAKDMARFRSQVVLYDTTLQYLEAIRNLPGIAADQDMLGQLESRKLYFSALRTLAIARSQALLGASKNSLALLTKAVSTVKVIKATDDDADQIHYAEIPQNRLTSKDVKAARELIEGLQMQFHALVNLDRWNEQAVEAEKARAAWINPLVERLDEYPAGGADLSNLVSYPPKLRPVPINPIFLDVAWNYIHYPGQRASSITPVKEAVTAAEQKPAKKGWFGFGGRA